MRGLAKGEGSHALIAQYAERHYPTLGRLFLLYQHTPAVCVQIFQFFEKLAVSLTGVFRFPFFLCFPCPPVVLRSPKAYHLRSKEGSERVAPLVACAANLLAIFSEPTSLANLTNDSANATETMYKLAKSAVRLLNSLNKLSRHQQAMQLVSDGLQALLPHLPHLLDFPTLRLGLFQLLRSILAFNFVASFRSARGEPEFTSASLLLDWVTFLSDPALSLPNQQAPQSFSLFLDLLAEGLAQADDQIASDALFALGEVASHYRHHPHLLAARHHHTPTFLDRYNRLLRLLTRQFPTPASWPVALARLFSGRPAVHNLRTSAPPTPPLPRPIPPTHRRNRPEPA